MNMTIRKTSVLVFSLNILAIVVALIISYQGGRDPFGERGYITFLSTFQLLAIAWISDKILQTKKELRPISKRSAQLFWRIISIGFIFLAADEFLAIHEATDVFIHSVLDLQETPVTDRIDDVIVGLYGIFGGYIVWRFRDEIKGHKRAIACFKWGFILLFGMVVLDILSNDESILARFFTLSMADTIQMYLSQLEDSIKIIAEGFFIMAFYMILKAVEADSKRLEYSKTDLRSDSTTPARRR